jgi:hypothetical protein
MRSCFYLLCSLTLVLSYPQSGFAATINAASPSATDVQAAINRALDRDTVVVPPGSVTWTSSVTVSNKSVTILGAGPDLTNITGNIASKGSALGASVRSSPVDFVTVSGISFGTVNGSISGILNIGNSNANGAPALNFRVTNCKFNHTPTNGADATGTRALQLAGVYGLVDHCTFISTSGNGGQMITINRDNPMSTANTYHTPQPLGDTNCVCIEDCTFKAAARNDGAFDMYTGCKVTFRHNTVDNTFFGWHGYDSGNRSARSFEVYQNTCSFSNGLDGNNIVVRGGTGVIWGNTFDSHWGDASGNGFIGFLIYAADHVFVRPVAYSPSAFWGSTASGGGAGPVAEAGKTATGSAKVDGNLVGPGPADQGYPLLDQPGHGSFPVGNPGNWPTASSYSDSTYEALDPIYQWGNKVNGNTSPRAGCQSAATANYVKANRDYYDNVAKPGYTPLQYPHPLTQTSSPLAAPKNLTVVPN